MSRHHYTGSRGELARHCLYWARPDVVLPPRDTSAAADLGSALHELAADEGDGGEDVADFLPEVLLGDAKFDEIAARWDLSPAARADLEVLVGAWRDWWPSFAAGRAFRTEVPYAFDVTTARGRELPSCGQRDYDAAAPTEIPTTVDAVAVEPGLVTVIDLKTGRGTKRLEMYRRQLTTGALAACRAHDVDAARIVLAHVTADGVHVDEGELDAFDLDAAGLELRDELARIPTAEPTPGVHCAEHRCPARAVCPVTLAAVQRVDVALLDERALTGEVEHDVQARLLIERLPMLDAWLAERKRALRAYVEERGDVDVGDGRVYTRVQTTRETPRLDVTGAYEALARVLGPDVDRAVERKTSKAAIERVARASILARGGRRGDAKRIRDDAIEALRGARAMKRSTFTMFEVRERAARDTDEPEEVSDG